MTSAFSWQNTISLCPASFCITRPNLPVTPGVSGENEEEIPLIQGKKNPSKMVGVARGQTHWNHNHRKLVNLITLGP